LKGQKAKGSDIRKLSALLFAKAHLKVKHALKDRTGLAGVYYSGRSHLSEVPSIGQKPWKAVFFGQSVLREIAGLTHPHHPSARSS
jgi:hypothetical protein